MRPADRDGAPPHEEPDRLPVGRLLTIGAAALLIAGGGVLWSWSILERREAALRPRVGTARIVPDTRPPTVGLVYQSLIEEDRPGLRLRAEQRRALETYGWVDRPAGIARIPIERAMDIVAGEAK